MELTLFHYQLLYQILERIYHIHDEEQLAGEVLENISTALNAEGATIFKLMPNKALYPLASFGVPIQKLREQTFKMGKGVAGWVAQYGQPVKVDNPYQDPRFVGQIDSATNFKTKSILAVPILAKGKTIGVIEFLNSHRGSFGFPDMEIVGMVGREVGIAFENLALQKEISQTKTFLNGFADGFSAGIVVVNEEEEILKVNVTAFTLFGMEGKEEDWLGRPVSELFGIYPEFVEAIKNAVKTTTRTNRQQLELTIQGKVRTIGYSGMIVSTPSKERLGSGLLFQDISAFVKK